MSCCPNEHRCGCNDPIEPLHVCRDCGKSVPADQTVAVTFPDDETICIPCRERRIEDDAKTFEHWRSLNRGPMVHTFAVGYPLLERECER